MRFKHPLKALAPRNRRLLAATVVVAGLVLLGIVYYLDIAMPRSRALEMVKANTPQILALDTSLGQLTVALNRQRSLSADVKRGGLSGEVAQNVRVNSQSGQQVAQSALNSARQIRFVVNSFGNSVGVGWMPVLLGGRQAGFANDYLIGNVEFWADVDSALQSQVSLFAYYDAMTPIWRDFMGYDPAVDLSATLGAGNKELAMLRIQRTLADIDGSIAKSSEIPPPESLLQIQERWLKGFVVMKALLTEIQQYVQAGDFGGANDRLSLYVSTVKSLQKDLLGTVLTMWDKPVGDAAIRTADTTLAGMATFVAPSK